MDAPTFAKKLLQQLGQSNSLQPGIQTTIKADKNKSKTPFSRVPVNNDVYTISAYRGVSGTCINASPWPVRRRKDGGHTMARWFSTKQGLTKSLVGDLSVVSHFQ